MLALCAFIFAGFIPASKAQITVSIAKDTPAYYSAVGQGTSAPVENFILQKSSATKVTIQALVYGPVTGAYIDDGSVKYYPVTTWQNQDGSHGYFFQPVPVKAGGEEFRLWTYVGAQGAGNIIYSVITDIYDLNDYIDLYNLFWGNTLSVVTNAQPLATLVNLSSRGVVSTGNPLVAGFVITGDPRSSQKFLVRGIGPTLKTQGILNALADPVMTIYDSKGKIVAQNDNWGDDADYANTMSVSQSVWAFPLPTGSKDAAKVVELLPGAYTSVITSSDGTAGVALAEVYYYGN